MAGDFEQCQFALQVAEGIEPRFNAFVSTVFPDETQESVYLSSVEAEHQL